MGGRFDLFTHKVTAIVKLHFYSRFIFVMWLLWLYFVIKCGCFNDLGESVMQQQDDLPSLWTTWVGFPPNFKGKQCHWPSHHTQVEYRSSYRSERVEHGLLSCGKVSANQRLSCHWAQYTPMSVHRSHIKRGARAPRGQSWSFTASAHFGPASVGGTLTDSTL